MYDELNLDEEEEKFGLVADERDSDDSDEASEGSYCFIGTYDAGFEFCLCFITADLPPRTPSKKHDEESVSSSKRDGSPIMKKASVALQLRSELCSFVSWKYDRPFNITVRAFNSGRR